jgi:hypothetical protein
MELSPVSRRSGRSGRHLAWRSLQRRFDGSRMQLERASGSCHQQLTYVAGERVLNLGLPLVIRSGGREGVLEATPTVLFNYHRVGEQHQLLGIKSSHWIAHDKQRLS